MDGIFMLKGPVEAIFTRASLPRDGIWLTLFFAADTVRDGLFACGAIPDHESIIAD